MKIRDMFRKVEAYNEIAELMGTTKARIYFADMIGVCSIGEHFSSYSELSKYVRHEFYPAVARMVLEFDGWEMDKEHEFEFDGRTLTFAVQLTA